MAEKIIICTDGSDLATRALRAGLDLVRPRPEDVVVVAVVEMLDPTVVTGAGMAGGTMSAESFDAANAVAQREGEAAVDAAVEALGLGGASTQVLRGAPGPAIVELARALGARAVIIGTRGRGGLKRAVLGSVSDHVVRNAPCPVVVTGPED